jgi:hypothetical protein
MLPVLNKTFLKWNFRLYHQVINIPGLSLRLHRVRRYPINSAVVWLHFKTFDGLAYYLVQSFLGTIWFGMIAWVLTPYRLVGRCQRFGETAVFIFRFWVTVQRSGGMFCGGPWCVISRYILAVVKRQLLTFTVAYLTYVCLREGASPVAS